MSSLVSRRSRTVRPDQALSLLVAEHQQPALLAAARVQSAAYATNVAIRQAAMLSMVANQSFKLSPMGEDMYQMILVSFGSLAATEIQSLSLQGRCS